MICWVNLKLDKNLFQDLKYLFSELEHEGYVTATQEIPVTLDYALERMITDPDHTKGLIVDIKTGTIRWCNFEYANSLDHPIDMLCNNINEFMNAWNATDKAYSEIFYNGKKYRLVEEEDE